MKAGSFGDHICNMELVGTGSGRTSGSRGSFSFFKWTGHSGQAVFAVFADALRLGLRAVVPVLFVGSSGGLPVGCRMDLFHSCEDFLTRKLGVALEVHTRGLWAGLLLPYSVGTLGPVGQRVDTMLVEVVDGEGPTIGFELLRM